MQQNMTFWEKIKRFFEPLEGNKIICMKGIFVSFLWGISGIIHLVFLERIAFYLEKGDKDIFRDILMYYLIYIFTYEIVNFSVKKWGWVEVIPSIWNTSSQKYLQKYILLDNNRVEYEGTGKLISVIHGGIRQWGGTLWGVIEVGMSVIVSVLFGFYMVYNISIGYAILFLLLFIIFSVTSVYFSNKLHPFRIKRTENMHEISKVFTKILMNKTEILQSNNTANEIEKVSKLYDIDEYINKQMSTNRQFMKRNYDFGIGLFFVASYYVLGNIFFAGDIGLHIIVGFGGALILMQRAIAQALSFYVNFSKEFVIIQKLWDFFDSTPEMTGYEEGNTFKYKTGDITIQNLSYEYSENKPVFTDFNLHISGQKITALVGNSGSGKSTLVKLIAGYIKSNSGEIIIDDQKLSETSLKSYYKDIGYLTQEPSVFDGSVLDNLTYAIAETHEASESHIPSSESLPQPSSLAKEQGVNGNENLKNIISLAKCEFIYDLPNGLDTEIGERGVRLSGGQRQRLAIAKIMLKDPKIIILDEPTSALDSFSEEQITGAMNNLFKNRTVIVIAHRLQTVKHADRILVLENGKITEEGNHKTLVGKKGVYAKMLELQSGF